MIIDMHCHAHEYDEKTIIKFISNKILIVSVADDPSTSIKNIEIGEKFKGKIIPCVGIHPWEINKYNINDVYKLVDLAIENNIKCIGEIGLDRLFVSKTISKQIEIFKAFLEASRSYDFIYNLHTPKTWREVFELLVKYDVKRAYFHWYTGPTDLLKDIESMDYFIGINPAALIQEKHKRIIEKAPLKIMITESDGPYKYKSLQLNPFLIEKTIELISYIKGVEREYVVRMIEFNVNKILNIMSRINR